MADFEGMTRDAGAPPAVVDYLKTLPSLDQGPLRDLLLVWLAASFAAAFAALPWIEDTATRAAVAHANEEGALLYHSYPGFGWLIAAVAIAFGFGPYLIATGAAALSRHARAAHFVERIKTAKTSARAARWLQRLAHSVPPGADPPSYVSVVVSADLRRWLAVPVLSLATAVAALAWSVQAYSLFTPNYFVDSPALPWEVREKRPWTSTVSVEVACDQHQSTSNLVYIVRFGDGASAYLDSARPLSGTWIDAAERVDAAVRGSGAPISRWGWLGRDPKDPRCIAVFREILGDKDARRVMRLLRLAP